jgi:hypothetical protein
MTTTTSATTTDLDKVASHLVDVGRTWSHPAPASAEQTRQRLRWAAEDLLDLLDGNSMLGPLELTHPWTHGGQVIGGDLRRMFINGYPKGTGIDQQLLLASTYELIHNHAGQTGPTPAAMGAMGAFLTDFCQLLADGHNGIGYQLALVDVDEHDQVVHRGEDLAPALPDMFAAAWTRWLQQRGQSVPAAAAAEPATGIAGVDPVASTEPWLDEQVRNELADRTRQQVRVLAERYLRLLAAMEMTMPDVDDWDDGTGERDLAGYVDHLTDAVHGTCELCRRPVFAPHPVTQLPVAPAWHPRRWRQALTAISDGVATGWRLLRHGGNPIAHTSCTRPW